MRMGPDGQALREFRPEQVPLPRRSSRSLQGAAGHSTSPLPPLWVKDAQNLTVPLVLELGCGVGWYPIAQARAYPQKRWIALERTVSKFKAFQGRVDRHRAQGVLLPNLLPIHADAVHWVTHLLPPGVVSEVVWMYPNPERQNPAARWMRMPFMGFLLSRLRPGARLKLVTNVSDYATEANTWAQQVWGLNRVESLELRQGQGSPRTHFEKKYLERGEVCFEQHWVLPPR